MPTAKQMPGHVNAAYRDAAENIIFLKRQQWLATNYVLLLYAAIFLLRGPQAHGVGLTTHASAFDWRPTLSRDWRT
jgi:hypothetical protein